MDHSRHTNRARFRLITKTIDHLGGGTDEDDASLFDETRKVRIFTQESITRVISLRNVDVDRDQRVNARRPAAREAE